MAGRDPIAEQGGMNLYNFVQNNAINRIDILGKQHKIDSIYMKEPFLIIIRKEIKKNNDCPEKINILINVNHKLSEKEKEILEI